MSLSTKLSDVTTVPALVVGIPKWYIAFSHSFHHLIDFIIVDPSIRLFVCLFVFITYVTTGCQRWMFGKALQGVRNRIKPLSKETL